MYTNIPLVAASMVWLVPGALDTQPPQDGGTQSTAELIHKAIVENRINDQRLFAQVAALGPTIAPQVEAYLKDADPRVRCNAFETLVKLPAIAPRIVREALSSEDPHLQFYAVYSAKGLLCKPGVADAYVECLVVRGRGTDLMEHARDRVLPKLLPAERKAVLDRLIPRILQELPNLFSQPGNYEGTCGRATRLLLVLGQYGEPGDAMVLKAVTDTQARAEAAFPANEPNERIKDYLRDRQDRVDEAALFGAANLGNEQAWAAYSNDILTGTRETKLSRIELLWRFRPTRRVFELTDRLLDDKTEIQPYGTLPYNRRTCDLAFDVLGRWCSELEPLARTHHIYDDQQLAKARQVARSYIARMQTSFGPSDHHKTAFDLSADSRPATQRTIGSRGDDSVPRSRPAGASTRIELTTKIRSTQPAAQPTTEPSNAPTK